MNHRDHYHPAMGGGYTQQQQRQLQQQQQQQQQRQQQQQQQRQPFSPYQLLQQQHHQQQQQQPQPYAALGSIAISNSNQVAAPTCRDILNGRGQGVQRHPGNVHYRTLVFVNKGLYAKCPRADKMKISKGVVAAVRELGGRFLELDESTGGYRDIGDKKATEKTSQALREGQTKIRKQMYKDEEAASGNPTYDTSLLTAQATPVPEGKGNKREISAEGYFGYSVQVLESLYFADEKAAAAVKTEDEDEDALPSPPPVRSLPPPVRSPPVPVPSAVKPFSAPSGLNAAAMAAALDQFPGAVMAPPPVPAVPQVRERMPRSLPQYPAAAVAMESRSSVSRFADASASTPPLHQHPSTAAASAAAAMEMCSSFGRFTNPSTSSQTQQPAAASAAAAMESRSSIRGFTNPSTSPLTQQPSAAVASAVAAMESRSSVGRFANPSTSPLPQNPSVAVASAAAAMESRSSIGRFTNSSTSPLPQHSSAAAASAAAAMESRSSIGRFTNASNGNGFHLTDSDTRQSLGRLTNMSLASIFSINSVCHLLDSARQSEMNGNGNSNGHLNNNGDRGSIESVLSNEIRDLIRQSRMQLMQVENMTMDEMNGMGVDAMARSSMGAASHEDKDVVVFDEETMKDRVSDLRFTDVSRDNYARFGHEPNPRLTDSRLTGSTSSTDYSRTSLMDASMMTIPTEDMSVHGSPRRTTVLAAAGVGVYRSNRDDDEGDLASAELLLRLSTDNHGMNHAAV